MDPVKTLRDYIERTEHMRPVEDKPVFLSLRTPYKALGSGTIAKLLGQAINLAGLGGRGYSAKSFRPSAATAAVASKVPSETAMQLGRWKTKEVFL